MRFLPSILSFVLVASWPPFLHPYRAQNDTFEWSGRMTSGQTLEVQGIVGNITHHSGLWEPGRGRGPKAGRQRRFPPGGHRDG